VIALRWARRSSSGFTLIELVMVVSVIAVLAGILLPVLRCARSQAEKIQCVSNLHQLGRAFGLYLSDWNGVYPAPGGKRGDYNYWSQSGSGGIVSYVGSSGGVGTVWCCPQLTEWHGRYPARTYSMNSYLRDPPDRDYDACIWIFKGCPENMIEDPRRTILLYEGLPVTPNWPDSLDYIYRCGNWTCVRGWYTKDMPCLHTLNSWKPWHGDKNNYLYCDGHVRSFKPNKKPNRPPYDATNEWWVRKTEMAIRYKGW
jgi:prepilin-type N-terminal cleavage/methylation domain-containing protein/prepilin-type processing-associated H-X9-DG protein